MKRKVVLLGLLLSMLPLGSAWADDDFALNVNLQDGSTLQIVVEKQHPEISFKDGVMTIIYYKYTHTINEVEYYDERTELQLDRDEIVNLTVTAEATGIEDVKAEHQQKKFFLASDGIIHISGLKRGDRIQMVALDGKMVASATAGQDGEALLDLSSQSSGIYVVSINKDYSFKLIKP